jgi:hypothetical protein
MKISKKQNIITNRGNKYKFSENTGMLATCIGCAFLRNSVKFCTNVPCSVSCNRLDGKIGHFVKVVK